MTDTPKKSWVEVPPELEGIVSSFEQLFLTPATSPPLTYHNNKVKNQLSNHQALSSLPF